MSLLVLIAVTAAVVLYVRASRKQRMVWVAKLDLLGRWEWDAGDESITLAGQPDHGTYLRDAGGNHARGNWRLVGHDLEFVSNDGATITYDLRLFRAGCIGLKDRSGQGRIYEKARDNVVSLASARKPSS